MRLSIARWRKSSRSSQSGNCIEVACLNDAPWRKSSRSSQGSACVEVAEHLATIAVRDSKHCEGHDYPTLAVPHADWNGFVQGIQSGAFTV